MPLAKRAAAGWHCQAGEIAPANSGAFEDIADCFARDSADCARPQQLTFFNGRNNAVFAEQGGGRIVGQT